MIKFLEKLVVALYRREEAKAARRAEKATAYARQLAERAVEFAEHSQQINAEAVAHKSQSILHSVKAEKIEEFFGKF